MAEEKILIADDDPAVRRLLVRVVESNGFQAVTACDGTEAAHLASRESFALILLDIMMNGNDDGFHAIKRLREAGNTTPIMVLSGRRGDFDTLYGLDIGADDYVAKPFNPVILGGKIKALIRRNQAGKEEKASIIHAGPFSYNTITMELFKNGTFIPLSSREHVLMRLFLAHPGQVFTKEQLYELVWNHSAVDDNVIMVYISHLRNKIEDNSKNPCYIKTVWGIGYTFSCPSPSA